MRYKLIFLLTLIGFCMNDVQANNVRINGKVSVAGRIGKDTLVLTFPLAWDNSWREGENWDAAYIFLKYKRVGVEERWYHLYLNETDHNVGVGNTYSLAQTPTGLRKEHDNVGMFVFRNTPGSGNVSTQVRVKVNIQEGELYPYYKTAYEDFKEGRIEISVAAVEMVFVPYGPYYLGDAISDYSFVDKKGTRPYRMESEDSLTVNMMGKTQGTGGHKMHLRDLYPKGYDGFYCMKYELSQEQYVYFLNKIPYAEQKKRIGNELDKLSEGEYAFGTPSVPNYRNGIIIEERRGIGEPVLFGHNLERYDLFNSPKDGQSLACNYLTPGDMKAYADWVGLRPMSEMEYEKACRMRNPNNVPTSAYYAWNGLTFNSAQSVGSNVSTAEEAPNNGSNVNGGGILNGPLRCGSFARPQTTTMSESGATYWGIFDMSGNLAEMCCNVDYGGKMTQIEGDGSLISDVLSWTRDTVIYWEGWVSVPAYTSQVMVHRSCPLHFSGRYGNVVARDSFLIYVDSRKEAYNTYYGQNRRVIIPEMAWVDWDAAYGVRGGSFVSKDKYEFTVSGRANANLFVNSQRSPYVTFRLVKTVPYREIRAGRIGLHQEKFLDTAAVCAASPYVITEIDDGSSLPNSIVYTWECDRGKGWEAMQGENNQTLTLNALVNTDTACAVYKYRRNSVTPEGSGYSNSVTLVIPGMPVISSLQASVNPCGTADPVFGKMNVKTDEFRWIWSDRPAGNTSPELLHTETGMNVSTYAPAYDQFNQAGNFVVTCQAIVNGCPLENTLKVGVAEAQTCPASITADDGNVYQVRKMADCRCWIIEDMKTYSLDSKLENGVRMYNWQDLMYEQSSYNTSGLPSNICPPGYFVPTADQATNLITATKTAVSAEFKGTAKGCEDASGLIDGVYYWSLLFDNASDQNNFEYKDGWLLTILPDGKFGKTQEYYVPDEATTYPSQGLWAPVRCIKGKETRL